MGPVFEQLASEYKGSVQFVKVNVEEEGAIAATYGVQGIPNLILFHHGQPVAQFVGFRPKGALKNDIDKALTMLTQQQVQAQ